MSSALLNSAGDTRTVVVDVADLMFESMRGQPDTVAAECVCLDQVCSGTNIILMYAKDGVAVSQV